MVLAGPPTLLPMDADNVTDYRDRLAAALRHAGKNPDSRADLRWLADKIDVSYQAVKKIFDGTSKALSAANNALAARLLGVNPDWLALGDKAGSMLGALPLSAELLSALQQATADQRRHAENAARSVLAMEPLARYAATPDDAGLTKLQAAAAA